MNAQTPLIDIHPDHWAIVRRILQKHVPQYAVWAFGSRAKWSAKEYSDLDLAIITDKPLPLSVSAALEEDFSESDLPWKVDVVDWATTSEVFHKVIAQDKVVLQIPDSGSGWHETTLGKAFEVNPFRPLKRNTVTPFVPMDVLPVNARAIDRIETREYTGSGMRFQNGDTLIARITPCLENGKTAFVSGLRNGEVAHGSTEYIVLSGVPGKSDSLFGYYLSRAPVFRSYAIGHMEGTSGRQRVPASAVENFSLLLPPIEEQRAIAHILGTLDDKIELNRKQNETLEATAQAIFKAWFVDFEPVRAKMEGRWQRGQSLPGLPAHLYDLFPDRLVESELGEIPEGWSIGVLGDILSLRNERVMPSNETKMMHYVPIESIGARNLILSEWKNGGEAKSSLILFKRGDILFGAMRPYFHKVCIAPFDGVTRTTVFTLKPSMPEISAYALILAYQNETVEWATLHSEGSTIPYVKWKNSFEKMAIILPPEELQIRFNNTASPFIENAILNIEENTALAQLRDTLLPKLISGELTNSHCQRNQVFYHDGHSQKN